MVAVAKIRVRPPSHRLRDLFSSESDYLIESALVGTTYTGPAVVNLHEGASLRIHDTTYVDVDAGNAERKRKRSLSRSKGEFDNESSGLGDEGSGLDLWGDTSTSASDSEDSDDSANSGDDVSRNPKQLNSEESSKDPQTRKPNTEVPQMEGRRKVFSNFHISGGSAHYGDVVGRPGHQGLETFRHP
jgi:hypothetical protein